MKNHKLSPVFLVGIGIILLGGVITALTLRGGSQEQVTNQEQTPASEKQTASSEKQTTTKEDSFKITPAKSNGYTGVEGDVIASQKFTCEPRNEDEWYRTGRTFVVDPKNPQVMYVSIEYRGIFKSVDGGASWKSASKGIRAYAREDDPSKSCYSEYPVIRINPNDSNHLVIGLSSGGGGHLHPTNLNQQVGGVYQSFNAGESWELMIDNTMNTYVNDVSFDADGAIYYGTSSNPGSWTEADQNKLFVTKGLIYKTTDKGATWTELPTGIGSRTSATKVFVNSKNTKEMVAPTYSAVRLSANSDGTGISTGKDTSGTQLGLLSTKDGGATWEQIAFPGNAPVLSAAVSPTNFANQYYISGSSDEAFATFDAGKTFTKTKYKTVVAYDPFDATGKHMLAYSMQSMDGPALNLSESFDGGLTWKPKGKLPAEITSLNDKKTRINNLFWHPTDKNTIYMNGASGNVWISTNLGSTWKRILTYTDL